MNVSSIANSALPASATSASELAATRATGSQRKPFTAAAMRSADPAEQRAAVASQFEAILVRQLLSKTMTSMLGNGGESSSGPAASVYGDMITDTFAQQLTSGQGLGLGHMLEKQLAPRSVTASASTPAGK